MPVFSGNETAEDLKKIISEQDAKIAAIELELQAATDKNTALEIQAKTLRLALDPTQSGNMPWSRSRRRVSKTNSSSSTSSSASVASVPASVSSSDKS